MFSVAFGFLVPGGFFSCERDDDDDDGGELSWSRQKET